MVGAEADAALGEGLGVGEVDLGGCRAIHKDADFADVELDFQVVPLPRFES